jgi:hypothetical protein
VHLSQPTKAPLAFTVEADPPDLLRVLGREKDLRIAAGRDVGFVALAGLRTGAATVVLRLAGAGAGGPAPALRVSVEARSHDEFPDPVVAVTAEVPKGADASGVLVTGERRMSGLRGAACGVLRVRRSGFRGWATTPTDVRLTVEDPQGILEPLPALLTIAAGAAEPAERPVVRLRDAEGRATLRVQAAGTETVIAIESVTARWAGPAEVVVPRARSAQVKLFCRPGTEESPAWSAAADDTSLLSVRAAAASPAPAEEAVLVSMEPRGNGTTTVRVRAPHRPEFALRVELVSEETVLRDGRPTLLHVPAGSKGTVVLAPPKGARFEATGDPALPSGVRADIAKSGVVTVTIDAPLAAATDLTLPVRLVGAAAGTRVRVTDRVRSPQRAEVEIDASP